MKSNSSAITSDAGGTSFAASLTVPFRVLLALMSVAGLLGWAYHPDQSRASIQEAIRDVMTSGKSDIDRDQALSWLVFKLL